MLTARQTEVNENQNKQWAGRRNSEHNPHSKFYESNGPDVKVRGTASNIAEKCQQLARDAYTSGDQVAAEAYHQYAEHYYRGSGTSAVTRLINLLGADIARDLIPATSDNVRGYWESASVIGIHDRLLNSIGPRHTDPFDPLSLPAAWQDTEQAQRAKYRLMDQVETEFAGSSLFVVKDPRISRLLPLWIDVLQALHIDVKIVIPFRNPLEVAASLAQRDAISLPKALLLYFQSYLEVELASRGLPRFFVRYDTVLRDWQLFQRHLNELSGMRFFLPSASVKAEIGGFLTTELQHHKFGREDMLRQPDVPAIMVELFDAMCRAADMRDDLLARVSFDRLRATYEQVGDLFGRFVLAEREALQAEREALLQTFERSTSWRVTAPLRWTKVIATGFRSDALAVFRKLMLRRKGHCPAWSPVGLPRLVSASRSVSTALSIIRKRASSPRTPVDTVELGKSGRSWDRGTGLRRWLNLITEVMRPKRWDARRDTQTKLLGKSGDGMVLSEHIEGADGAKVYEHACRMRLEGSVAKRRDRPYAR